MDKLISGVKAIATKTSKSSIAPEDWESEVNQFVRDIRREALRIIDPSGSPEQKEAAITNLGYLSYTGGHAAASSVSTFLPHILSAIKDPRSPHMLVIAALRSLSLVCMRSRGAKDLLNKDPDTLKELLNCAADVADFSQSRWACYTIVLCITDHPGLMNTLRDLEGCDEKLSKAADASRPWTGWGANMAELALKMLAIRDPSEEVAFI